MAIVRRAMVGFVAAVAMAGVGLAAEDSPRVEAAIGGRSSGVRAAQRSPTALAKGHVTSANPR